MKVAVHAHMHYADLMEQVADHLARIPFPYDLIVTVTDPSAKPAVLATVAGKVSNARTRTLVVPNKGRDVKPFYADAAGLLADYDVIGHIHGKKSAFNNGATKGWLEHLLQCLMGSEETVRKIFARFQSDPRAGVIYPATFDKMPYWANSWLSNRDWAARLRDRLCLTDLPDTYFCYPVGNMFWARREAIRPLLELGLCDDDFPEENGQTDGEIMHALERMTTVVSRSRGYTNYVIRPVSGGITITEDSDGIDFSAYEGNSLDYLRQAIKRPDIRLVSFDIFDTLVVRPLSDPADLFELMHGEVEKMLGRRVDFRKLRIEADRWQRQRLSEGSDVTFGDIYERIAAVLQLSDPQRERLMELELQLESRFMRARSAVVDVMNYAYALGKQVILTSDMYLDKAIVVRLLDALGIVAYHRIYLSSDIGKRKDARTMFPHILQAEDVRPAAMLHVGDNEHSDIQIAGDLGIGTFHVMRPIDLFRQTPLGRSGFPGPGLSLFARVSFGLMLTRLYNDPFPADGTAAPGDADLRNFGYWYFGPTLLSFIRWVAERSADYGTDTLYFLARDGDVLIRIYRLLQTHLKRSLPQSVYLEVSRRSMGVPFIQRREQLDKLLEPDYSGGPLSELIRVRLGLDLHQHPEVPLRDFGFAGTHSAVFIPADLPRVKRLCYYLFEHYRDHFLEEKQEALGYLEGMGLFGEANHAVVDIGYSGTMQRILNEAGLKRPLHGFYMVLYKTFDTLMKNPEICARGLFGDRVDPWVKELSIDRYSLFYEMVLSSTRGPVTRYRKEKDGTYTPVYAPVSDEERGKLVKLPQIHEGIMEYCRDILGLLEDADLVTWEDTRFLLTPFRWFLEHPTPADLRMLAGYSLDDDYCGQGVLYWAPPPASNATSGAAIPPADRPGKPKDFLWKRYVPDAPLWRGDVMPVTREKYGGFANRREFEIFNWYQDRYERLPGWFKKLGQLFKILRGTKRVRIVLEDVGYVRNQPTKAEEIQAWYEKEYEILPKWYKKFGEILRRHTVS
ncbi:MAG TPA: rhamnan synthesis F family protein [Puia sp.]|nr:rhamnan synthesis F family protein [Puia sp.]